MFEPLELRATRIFIAAKWTTTVRNERFSFSLSRGSLTTVSDSAKLSVAESTKRKASDVRVVGYIREASSDGEPAFAQSEKIRRWINENGHRLVALCQDVRTPGHAVGREGLQSIVGIISAGQVDAIVVPTLDTFSADKITQEVIMSALRQHDVTLLSTATDDIDLLADPPADNLRMIVRDVLAKQTRFDEILTLPTTDEPEPEVVRIDETPDVVIELIPPDRKDALPASRVIPAQ